MAQLGRKCLLCKNSRKNPGCRLFRFPPCGTTKRQHWLDALGLQDSDIEELPPGTALLCQRHFRPQDFLTRKLSAMAVPLPYSVRKTEADTGSLGDPCEQEETLDDESVVESLLDNDCSETIEEHSNGSGEEHLVVEGLCHDPHHRDVLDKLQQANEQVAFLEHEVIQLTERLQQQNTVLKSLGVQILEKDD